MLAFALLTALAAAPAGAPKDAPAAAPGEVVEQIVAVVRNPASAPPRPVTLTRLVEEARVALVGQGALDAAEAPLDDAALRASLRWLVDELLVADEAARLQVDDVARDEVVAAVRRFKARFADAEAARRFLARLDLGDEELAAMLTRGLKVRRYLDSRVGRSARVSDDEVARAVAAAGGADSPGVRDAMRVRLAEEKAQATVKQLLADLRGRADVRVLAPALREEPRR